MREPLSGRRAHKPTRVSLSATGHPFISVFKDTVPAPEPVDQFAPYLSSKFARTKSKIKHRESLTRTKQITPEAQSRLLVSPTAGRQPHPSEMAVTATTCRVPAHNLRTYIELEKTFDTIASRAMDLPLSEVTEEHLKKYFNADAVFYYHDVESVQVLYCPTNGGVCPHGAGIVGFTQFVRRTQNIPRAREHVGFSEQYDGGFHDGDCRILSIPVFDHQNHVKGVVKVIRMISKSPFTEVDERAGEYFQSKFQLYARWIFQPVMSDIDIGAITQIHRLGALIESMTSRLSKIFCCKMAEIWLYERDRNEVKLYVETSGFPIPVNNSDSGVAGYAIMNACSVSLTSVNLHAAYNKKADGPGEQSVLIIPVTDPDSPKVYGIVLRGKRLPSFFTDVDEKILARLSPLLVTALRSSEVMERAYEGTNNAVREQSRLGSLLDAVHKLTQQRHMGNLMQTLMSTACGLVKADRCKIFIMNETRDKMVAIIPGIDGEEDKTSEVSVNAGLVGYTVTTGRIMNVRDAYEEPRFNRETDIATGYRTHTILCVPIIDDKGLVKGVTELVNKTGGCFTEEDEKTMAMFNTFACASIDNTRVLRAAVDLGVNYRRLAANETSDGAKVAVETIARNARKVMGVGRAMVFLIDKNGKECEVTARDEDLEARRDRIERGNRDAARGMKNAKRAVIQKLMQGPSAQDGHTKELGPDDRERNELVLDVMKTKSAVLRNSENVPEDSMLAVPVLDNDSKAIGAFLVQWKKRESGFIHEDILVLEQLAEFVAVPAQKEEIRATFGIMESDLQARITDSQRRLVMTPKGLQLEKANEELMFSGDLAIRDYLPSDPELLKVGFGLFGHCRLRKVFDINNEKLFCFLYTLRRMYKKESNHDWVHAVDVACVLTGMLLHAKLLDVFKPNEVLALIVAALCHDVGADEFKFADDPRRHIPQSVLFESQSVPQAHRCSIAIDVITRDECNIFRTMNTEDLKDMWRLVISLVIGTDVSKHFTIIDAIPKDANWRTSKPGRLHVMQLLLKAAQLAPVTRKGELITPQCDFICDEFLRYGPVDTLGMGDATTSHDARVRLAFYKSICLPVFTTLASLFAPLQAYQVQLQSNIASISGRQ